MPCTRDRDTGMQYTIRNVPKRLDAVVRKRAKAQRKSLNQVVIDALAVGAGVATPPMIQYDLDWAIGTWVEDAAFDQAIADQDQIESPSARS